MEGPPSVVGRLTALEPLRDAFRLSTEAQAASNKGTLTGEWLDKGVRFLTACNVVKTRVLWILKGVM